MVEVEVPGVEPVVVVADASEQAPAADLLPDGRVPARARYRLLQLADPQRIQHRRIEAGNRGRGAVEEEAERRPSAEPRRRVGDYHVQPLGAGLEVVGEEAEVLQIPGARHPFRDEPVHFRRRQGKQLRQGEAVGEPDPEVVDGEAERSGIDDRAQRLAERALRLQRLAAPELGDPRGGRDGAVVHQIHQFVVVLRGDVEGVLLAGRRRPKAAAHARAQGGRAAEPVAPRHFPVSGRAEVLEILQPERAADGPRVVAALHFHFAVERGIGAAPVAGGDRAETGESVGPGAETLGGIGADLPRRLLAQSDGEALVAPFGAAGEVHAIADGVTEVDVQADLVLPVEAGIERRRRGRAERGIDGVVDEEVRLAGAGARARVPQDAAAELPAQAGDQRSVEHVAAELRREAAGKAFLEGKAVRIVEHPRQRRLIRPGRDDRDGGTAGGAVRHAIPGVEHVADQQAPPLIAAEDGGARVGIPEEKAALDPPAGVIGVPVELRAAGEQVAEVAPQFQVVVDAGRTRDLRRIPHRVVAGGNQRRRVVALHAAVRRAGVPVLQAEVGEPGLAERQPGVAGHGVRAAVARREAARVQLDAAALARVLEQEVQHAGDGVRAVLGRRAVAQHLHLPQRD